MGGLPGDSATVRGLRAVFQDTPAKLKELEQGWRARRRRALSDITENVNVVTPRPGSMMPIKTEQLLHSGTEGGKAVVRHRRRPTSHSKPELTPSGAEVTNRKLARKQGKARAGSPINGNRDVEVHLPHLEYSSVRPAQRRPARQSLVLPRSRSPVPGGQNRVHSVDSEPQKTEQYLEGPIQFRKRSQEAQSCPVTTSCGTKSPSASSPTGTATQPAQHDHRPPQAVVAFPLPPTSTWTPADRDGHTLIRIEGAPSGYEIRLKMPDGERLDVRRGGAVIQIRHVARSPNYTPADGPGRQNDTYEIRLGDRYRWTTADRDKWIEVQSIVEEVKRRTPHVKIFHPLGQLVITCSDDIVLKTDLGARYEADITRDERTQTEITAGCRSCCSRVTLSPTKLELRIELSIDEDGASGPSSDRRDSFRSRRIVTPGSLSSSCGPFPRSSGRNGGPPGGENWSHTACFGLNMSVWLPEERAAVQRLCALREEWALYTKAR